MNLQKIESRPAGAMGRALASLLLFSLFGIATSAAAAPPTTRPAESVTTRVSLLNLDLDSVDGRLAAQQRLASAAKRLCNRFSDDRRVSNAATQIDCYQQTYGEAIRRLEASMQRARSDGGAVARNRP